MKSDFQKATVNAVSSILDFYLDWSFDKDFGNNFCIPLGEFITEELNLEEVERLIRQIKNLLLECGMTTDVKMKLTGTLLEVEFDENQ